MSRDPDERKQLPQTHGAAIDYSNHARERIASHGLRADSLLRDTAESLRLIREAGVSTATDLDEDRDDLAVHLRYWLTIQRILTGKWDEDQALPGYQRGQTGPEGSSYRSRIRTGRLRRGDLDRGHFSEQATTLDGVSNLIVRDFRVTGPEYPFERFAAENCRLINGRFEDVRIETLLLRGTSLVEVQMSQLVVDTIQAVGAVLWRSKIDLSIRSDGDASFGASLVRSTTVTICAPHGGLVFDDADIASDDDAEHAKLRSFTDDGSTRSTAKLEPDAATFADCEVARASFVGASLRNVRFKHCKLPGADFTHAQLDAVSFLGCELTGAIFPAEEFDKISFGEDCLLQGMQRI